MSLNPRDVPSWEELKQDPRYEEARRRVRPTGDNLWDRHLINSAFCTIPRRCVACGEPKDKCVCKKDWRDIVDAIPNHDRGI